MKKHLLNGALSLIILFVTLLIFIPYFTSDFLDLRQKKENDIIVEQKHEREEKVKRIQEEVQLKIYLSGKFDPSQRDDFVLVGEEYNIALYNIYLRKEVSEAFSKMATKALLDGIELNITSGTRNFDYQKELWNKKWAGVTFVDGKDLSKSIPDGVERFIKILEYSAPPGTSRHHWGTEIDISSVNPKFFETEDGKKVYTWLRLNSLLFGFCQTYNLKDTNRPTGYNEEKWHWSYLPLARNFTQEYKRLIKEEDIKGFDGDEYVTEQNLINDYVLGINPDCL